MKKNLTILLCLVLSCLSNINARGCLKEGITFSTQEQVDSFPLNHPGCTETLGYVSIKRGINNLDSLFQIIKIGGNLSVVNNNDLITLSGLRNLRFIEGHFSVSKNASLTSLSGLEKLISVKGDFVVINNEDLSTLNGLKNLNTIGGSFYVSNNTSLTSLNGLENLISIDNSLKVWKNPSLTSLNGLENLTSIGGYMDAYDNASLENQNGLKHVSVRGQIIDVKTKGLYKIWVMPMDKSPKLKGYLTGLEDSLITVSKHLNKLELTRNNQSINIQNIETIKFRRKGRIGRGILVGALTGFTIGGILGLSSEDDRRGIVSFTKEQKALMGGVVLSVPGAIIGAIIGSLKVKIPINGNPTTFKNRKKDLRNFMITN